MSFKGNKTSLADATNAVKLHSYNVAIQGISFVHYKDVLEDVDLVDHIISLGTEIHTKNRFRDNLDSVGHVETAGNFTGFVKDNYQSFLDKLSSYKLYFIVIGLAIIITLIIFLAIKLSFLAIGKGSKRFSPIIRYEAVNQDVEMRLDPFTRDLVEQTLALQKK